MKKRKQSKVNEKPQEKQDQLTLKDTLNAGVLEQLKEKQKKLKAEEEEKQAAAEQKKREERRQRERNKSFEELLNESSMDWKKFK
ncbi:DUF3886 domain-containing protein [Bacillus aerolatus]|uniref:DUF3886 domain-containing protein n=1 Tax=Bacillus aerolatus TaxID=2653354 RepID=A0A6I1FJF8_9BACI|nr:DUF3886 domain-containing protein [Bacillus aerolatus]KAB7708849.1 DUF3886 domain-containing protein [Bacillus aerolatus]